MKDVMIVLIVKNVSTVKNVRIVGVVIIHLD